MSESFLSRRQTLAALAASSCVPESAAPTLHYEGAPSSEDIALQASLAAPTGSSHIGFIQSGTDAIARSIQGKLRDTFSAKDFGATGDGTTADTAAIQAAIDAISDLGGGRLLIPCGNYRLTRTVTLKPGVSIIGVQKASFGDSSGVKFIKDFTSGHVFYSPAAQTIQSVTYENFFIEGDKSEGGRRDSSGIVIEKCNDVVFRHVWVARCPSNGFLLGQGSTSFHVYLYNCYAFFCGSSGYVAQCDWMRFIDCWADGNVIGIDYPDSAYCGSNSRIERCHFEEWRQAAIAIRGNPQIGGNGDHRIRDSVFYSRPYNHDDGAICVWLDSAAAAAGCSGNIISGNKMIYQNKYGPPKTDKYAVHMVGGKGGYNTIENNSISGFGTAVNIIEGSIHNKVINNLVDSCEVGVNNAALNTTIDRNEFSNNSTDLSDTGMLARVTNNHFAVAPTLHATDFASGNNSGSLGAWSPSLTFGGRSRAMTYATQSGRFEKHGRTVIAHINVVLNSKGSSTGPAEFNLPITPTNLTATGFAWIKNGLGITSAAFAGISPSSDKIALLHGAGIPLSDANFTDTSEAMLTVVYEA